MMQYGQVFVVYPSRNRLVQRILLPALAIAFFIAVSPTLVSTLLHTQQIGVAMPAGPMVLLSLALVIWAPFFQRDVIRRRGATLMMANFQGNWMSVAGARAAWAHFWTPASRQALRTLSAFGLGTVCTTGLASVNPRRSTVHVA